MYYLDKLLEINKQQYPEVDMYENISGNDFYSWAIDENNYKNFDGIKIKGVYAHIGKNGIIFFEILRTSLTLSVESRFSHTYVKSEIDDWYFKDFMLFMATIKEICECMDLKDPYDNDIFENDERGRADFDRYIDGKKVTNVWVMSDSKWLSSNEP